MASISVIISSQGAAINVQADTSDPELIELANLLHLNLAKRALTSAPDATP